MAIKSCTLSRSMKVLAENYRGIDFIRISRLPEAQKRQIALSLPPDKIIKILKDNELLTDCVQFKHYESWFDTVFQKEMGAVKPEDAAKSESIRLAMD